MKATVYQIELDNTVLDDSDVLHMMHADLAITPKAAFPDWALWVFSNTNPVRFEVSSETTIVTNIKGGGWPSGMWVEPTKSEVSRSCYTVYAVLDEQDAMMATISGVPHI